LRQLGVENTGNFKRLAVKDGGLTVGCCCDGGGPCCDFTCLHPQCVTAATSGYRCCELGSDFNVQITATGNRTIQVIRPIVLTSGSGQRELLPGYFSHEFTSNLNLYVRCGGQFGRTYTADGFFRSTRNERPSYRDCGTGEFVFINNDQTINLEGVGEASEALIR
jgi:hypothetical protein